MDSRFLENDGYQKASHARRSRVGFIASWDNAAFARPEGAAAAASARSDGQFGEMGLSAGGLLLPVLLRYRINMTEVVAGRIKSGRP